MKGIWRKTQAKVIIYIFVIIMILPQGGIASASEVYLSEEEQLLLERYWEVFQYIKEYHVSAPSGDSLTEWAIKGLTHSLNDPYTYYMNQEEYDSLRRSINGNIVGIGAILNRSGEGILIEELISGSPAAASGLLPGDIITHVNGKQVAELATVAEVVGMIAGEEGRSVAIKVDRWRNQRKTSEAYTIVRASLQLPLTEAFMLSRETAYLRLRSFGEETYDQAAKRLAELRNQGMTGLILDLRGNSGGYLEQVAQVVKLFGKSGVLLHQKNAKGVIQPYTFDGGQRMSESLAVLVDGDTASASEVLSGYLQDEGIGRIIGTTTYGKGTIQELVALESGGVLRITVEEYFTPDKHAVQDRGITPDSIVADRRFQLAKAYGELTNKNEMTIDKQGALLPNGLERAALFNETYSSNGKMYVSVRTLMEWFGGEAGWDNDARAVVAHLSGKKVLFKQNDPALKLVHSRSFVDVERIAALLPLEVHVSGDSYVIRAKR